VGFVLQLIKNNSKPNAANAGKIFFLSKIIEANNQWAIQWQLNFAAKGI
jgi:hypothetical protein